jgi:hypothetical protein
MSDIDSDMLGFAKKEFGENCELEKRTEWSCSFRCGSVPLFYFAVHGGTGVRS